MRGKFQLDFSKVFPALPQAPIVEAVLHWQAAASTEWDETALRDKLSKSFPEYEIAPQHNIDSEWLDDSRSPAIAGLRLTKKVGGRPAFTAQFKQNGLIFSRLAPYPGWPEFEREALRFWRAFLDIAKPNEIARLSTRFISQISLHSISEVQDYVNVAESPLTAMGASIDGFFHQDTLNLGDLPYIINLVRTVQPKQQGSSRLSLIVDIDVATTDTMADFSTLPQKLTELRFIKNEVFFILMKDAETKFGGKTS